MAGKKDGEKNVFWLGLTSFFTDVGSEMIFPILPIFLTSILRANIAVVGVIEGVAESASSILKLYSGWLSDRLGKRKGLVVLGYALSALTKPMFGFATHWTHALGARVADRVGKGIRTSPRDALIAASARTERGKWFGLHRMMDTLGAVAGTVIATILLWKFAPVEGTFRLIFWLSLIPGLLAVILLIAFVREARSPQATRRPALAWKTLPASYRRFVMVSGLFGLANFSYAFFLLRAQDLGMLLALIPLLYLIYNLFYAFTSVPAGQLADRFGKKAMLAIGWLLFAVTSFGFAKVAEMRTLWLLFAMYGVFMGITDGVARAYISDLVEEKRRGTALGVYGMVLGILVIPANLVGGLLWDRFGVGVPFLAAAVIAAMAALLLIMMKEGGKMHDRRKHEA